MPTRKHYSERKSKNKCDCIRALLNRNEKVECSQKAKKVNIKIAKACKQYNWQYIEHKNIENKHLNPYGLHLNKFGTSVMAKNFANYFNSKQA